jgi:hypothetical protein
MTLRVVPFVVAALLFGAHSYRAGNLPLVVLCLAAPLLFFYRKRWSLVLLQVMAYGAAAVWLEAAIRLVAVRRQIGQPWTLAAIILGAVALFTLVTGLLLNSRTIADRFPARQAPEQ